ncbi:MAG: S8 family serine peptidase, partial [Oscillospiraceae bacterium]|nr:S8 family serine peptidase [Oscillospiraceae bacterium]
YDGLHVLQYPTAADAYLAYNAFCADDRISLAEPELIYRACDTDDILQLNEELLAGNWGYDAVGCDEFMQRLDGEQNEADPLCVAVLDTGITAEHSWFKDRIAAGGCSFVPGVTDVTDDNDHGHGTFCAGIIAHSTRSNVKILPLKVLERSGYGTSLEVYCGMLYAAEQGADVINMSLSGTGQSLLLQEGARLLREQGIPCIAAAGNSNRDVIYDNPANIQDVIAVSSVSVLNRLDPAMPPENRYALSGFSNWGKQIDFSAPGEQITGAYYHTKNGLSTNSGTSMAAPFVTACYANLLDYDRSLTPDAIYNALMENAVDPGYEGIDIQFGNGMVCLKDFVFSEQYCSRPKASLKSGHLNAVTSVTLSCYTNYAEIYYTTDGSIPGPENGIRYEGEPIPVSRSLTLKAVSCTEGAVSSVMTCDYCMDCPVPEVSVKPGNYDDAVSVELRSAVPADIYYTLDGSAPDPATARHYEGETLEIGETTLLGAVAVIGEMQSEPLWAAYQIGGMHPERLLRFEGSVLTGCCLAAREINLSELAGDRTVTEIAPHVFADRRDLTAVILPDTVTVLGESAFENCGSLRRVTAKGAVTLGSGAFSGCAALESVSLGAVTAIPSHAFSGCRALKTTGIAPETLRSVGAYAFAGSGCTDVFDLPALESLGGYAFAEMESVDLTLPERITKLPDGLCCNTAELALTAKGVTEIGAYALSAESSLRTILRLELPFERITDIGERGLAFVDLNQVCGGQILFSSLTEADRSAFSHVSCRGMAFPLLKTVLSGTFASVRTEVLRLDSASVLCPEAISPKNPESCCLIFGNSRMDIDEAALGDPLQYAAVAAPAQSDAAKICRTRNYPFRETPDLFLPE